MKHFRGIFAVLLVSYSSVPAANGEVGAVMHERHRSMLQNHCLKCHDANTQEGAFRVDDLPFTVTNLLTAERWQKVLHALNSGEMPPENEKQPETLEKADFLDDLAHVMVIARKHLGDQHGVVTMRRLNRREYQITLRELLGVEIQVSDLPADTGMGGFDTVGANLFVSGNQIRQYLALGREALDEAFERQATAAIQKKMRYEPEETLPIITKFVRDEIDAMERALRWAKAVEQAAARPENLSVVAEMRKTARDDAALRRFWNKIPGAPGPGEFGFTDNNVDKANRALNSYFLTYQQYYLDQPALDTGAYLTVHGGSLMNSWISMVVPLNWPPGDYMARIRVAATEHAPAERRFLEFGLHPRNGQVVSTHEVTGTMDSPQLIEIPLTLTRKSSTRDDRTVFVREKGTGDHIIQSRLKFDEGKQRNGVGPELAIWVDWLEVERMPMPILPLPPGLAALGIPLDDTTGPLPAGELRAALQRFAREAFRGATPPASYSDRLLGIYNMHRQAGAPHSVALKETMAVVIASPMFLYLSEPVADGESRVLTGLELATRLSYFLWGGPPDAALRDLAQRGELSKPEVLTAEADRLLDDPRAEGFVRAFVHQWLGLERLEFFETNRVLYPRFDDSTKMAARDEVYETFGHLLRHNASLRDLLRSDYVVINSLLAKYYGMDGVQGDAFRKVQLPENSPRGGLLGMAAIHVMGGNGEHSNPVERGAWVLRNLLNDPPPPAPANVPQITRLAGQLLTTRERLQAHQDAPQCASCHRKIDPIGLGLENFDAVGQWRVEDSYQATDADGKPNSRTKKTWTIDPAGSFHKGPGFKDFFEMREIIATRSDDFGRGFSMALIEYALGRPVGFSDEPLVESMLQAAARQDLAVRDFIHGLVGSRQFHSKLSKEP